MDNLLAEPQPKYIELGGKQYQVSPANLNLYAGLEMDFNCGIDKLGDAIMERQATSLRKILYRLLKKNNPELTEDSIGEMVTADNMEDISRQIGEFLKV